MRRPKEPLAVRLFMARQQANDLRRAVYDQERDLEQLDALFAFSKKRALELLRRATEHRDVLEQLVRDADAGAWPNEVQLKEPRDHRLNVKKPPPSAAAVELMQRVEEQLAPRRAARNAKDRAKRAATRAKETRQ
ncbi:MAG: hypothetical protein ACKVWV_20350 [Planctomycetota bacterium]